ncbi:MAG: type II secretion system GspH family protein [Candidatus Omnitrophica bacterium]|nr:type II secretion system GspH family protein [Candidatus Omnitrophota bacterium]
MKGFTLIETIISIVVIGIAFLGLVAVITGVFTNASHDEVIAIATMLAKGEIERVSGLGWPVVPDSGTFSGNFSDYSWEVDVTNTDSEHRQIDVTVTNTMIGSVTLTTMATNN